ncbi:gliding motility-associated ABC transporter substrate-binding protein GldG [Salinimicrobium tongyeongense]|uniref:Gliding motility-associated ABC transporter substrate-binding protein GldG n=1 Tax=Salinimicrobium tongyeongense TaxID=2809707 RepID=A0ABY6NSE0_9FLAO|nr:gliding motility-associated ABC transporter substrate-binding protein GldG [Salinimicrobium tongyeongense]UZH55486.1 gliding motility-associated ABC transporter substrate-binding protein GldG [Salinimicrobium tongyeongense]
MNPQKSHFWKVFLLLLAIIGVNVLSYNFFGRFDLTADKRYTLSEASEEIISKAEAPVIIDVFLEGEFPPEFRKLQAETRQLLEEFAAVNPQITYRFTNPLEEGGNANEIASQFYEMGMTPARINVVENGRTSEAIVFPWAMANFGNKSVAIPLLKNQLGATTEDRVAASVQQLEYAFADAFSKLLEPKRKKVAVMRGNGELEDKYIADFIRKIQEYYFIAPFTLDSVAVNPQRTLNQLSEYDLLIEAKPTEPYTEAEKLVLDQYLMNGGKQLWLVEHAAMETDSLFTPAGSAFALPRDLNLGDYFFKYGLRINPALVKDLYSAPIILATGSGNNAQFNPYPWFYFPLSSSPSTHPVVTNLEAVKFEYANPIDTLQNDIDKTVLLATSPRSAVAGLPREISLEEITAEPNPAEFTAGEQPLAVLLEGNFSSVYDNRILPFQLNNFRSKSEGTKILVISDGDVIKNQLQRGEPLELGFDRYTGTTYGNREFLLNAVNYLLDDRGLINIRSREVKIAFLNPEKAEKERTFWQMFNIALPLGLLAVFAVLYRAIRRKKYVK